MKTALLTINFNGHVCQNTRDSFVAATERWGSDYVEITETSGHEAPFPMPPQYWKLFAFGFCDADRIMVLDADTIIRIDTPSPFEMFSSENAFVACINKQPQIGEHYLGAARVIEAAEFERIYAAGHERVDFDFDRFVNSGMWIGSRKYHESVVRPAATVGRDTGTLGWWDQAALNYMLAVTKTTLHLADTRWNYCMPSSPWDRMSKYIYHFAGNPERYDILPQVNWRAI